VVGASIALGPVARRDAGAATGALRKEVWQRALRIVALGLLLHAVAWWLLEIDAYRPWGVLQRIGICYAAAAWLAIHADARLQWAVTGLLLGAYALLLALGGSLAPLDNVLATGGHHNCRRVGPLPRQRPAAFVDETGRAAETLCAGSCADLISADPQPRKLLA
jgi:predicted acyltransferase